MCVYVNIKWHEKTTNYILFKYNKIIIDSLEAQTDKSSYIKLSGLQVKKKQSLPALAGLENKTIIICNEKPETVKLLKVLFKSNEIIDLEELLECALKNKNSLYKFMIDYDTATTWSSLQKTDINKTIRMVKSSSIFPKISDRKNTKSRLKWMKEFKYFIDKELID